MRNEFLWVEKYRPKTIEECILPNNIKKTFKDFLIKGRFLIYSLQVLLGVVKQL